MRYISRPEIFGRDVTAFFTGRDPGLDFEPPEGKPLYMPEQKHTCEVMVLGSDLVTRVSDAVVTGRSDVLLGVQVADCVPILLYDRRNAAVGAVHAGWRGTAQGILKKTIRVMAERYGSVPGDILMAMGPAIRWCCYKVGSDVLEAVRKETGEGRYHLERDGTLCLDLPSANWQQAVSVNIPEDNIWLSEECTYCHPDKFYSYRYSKGPTGRQGGFIGMS
jgi:YfiH family protein